MMKVLFVENSYGEMGGSLVSLYQLAKELQAQNALLPPSRRVEPCFYFLYPNLLLDDFRRLGEVILEREDYQDYGSPVAVPRPLRRVLSRLPGKVGKALGEILPLALRVAGHARRLRVDLIHANCRLGSNEYAILGAMMAGLPVIAHERLIYHVSPLTRPFAAKAHRVIAISRAVAHHLTSQGIHERLEVIYNGINTEELAPFRNRPRFPGAPLRVGMVGRMTPWKGQHVLLEAIQRVLPMIPDAEFHLAGDAPPIDGAYLQALQETVEDAGLQDHVFFHGNVKEIYDFMAGMDVMVHCSIEPEPLGRVILESMALAKPTIATRGGAVEEICTDGHDALVVDPARPEALSDAIIRIAREPELAARIGANALRTIETRFSLAVAATRVRALYEQAASAPARRPLLEAMVAFLASSPFSRTRTRTPTRN